MSESSKTPIPPHLQNSSEIHKNAPTPHRPELNDVPPILGSWRNIYILNMVIFVVMVILFVLLTRIYT